MRAWVIVRGEWSGGGGGGGGGGNWSQRAAFHMNGGGGGGGRPKPMLDPGLSYTPTTVLKSGTAARTVVLRRSPYLP